MKQQGYYIFLVFFWAASSFGNALYEVFFCCFSCASCNGVLKNHCPRFRWCMLWLPCQQWLPDQLFLIRLRLLLWHSLLCKLTYLGSSCIRLFVARTCVCVVTFMYFRKMLQYSSLALGWSSDAIQEIETRKCCSQS